MCTMPTLAWSARTPRSTHGGGQHLHQRSPTAETATVRGRHLVKDTARDAMHTSRTCERSIITSEKVRAVTLQRQFVQMVARV